MFSCVTKRSLTCEQRILILQPRLKRRWVRFSHQRSQYGMSSLKLENQPLSSRPPLIFPFYYFYVTLNTYSNKSVGFFFSNFSFMGIFDVAHLFASVQAAQLELLEQGKRQFKEVNGGKKKKKSKQWRLKQRWYPLRKPLRSPAQQLLMETRWRRVTERAAVSGYIPFPLGKLPPQTHQYEKGDARLPLHQH